MIYVDLPKATMLENCCEHWILYIWMTEYKTSFELVELKMDLANSTLPKCQFQFKFRSLEKFNSNSNSTHFGSIPIQFQFGIELTPALLRM